MMVYVFKEKVLYERDRDIPEFLRWLKNEAAESRSTN
jgi:hypothetical protein